MKLDTKDYEAKMKKTIASYSENLSTIRAGRANPDVLKKISVDYYGSPTPISSIAEIKVTDARTITITAWDKSIIKGIEFAKRAGADVIALTDSESSPIAEHADQLLVAQSDMASFADSLVAPMSVINALIVAVTRERSEEFSARLRRLEEAWDEYQVYNKNNG